MAKFSATLLFVIEADSEELAESILDRISAVPGVVDTDVEVGLTEIVEEDDDDDDVV